MGEVICENSFGDCYTIRRTNCSKGVDWCSWIQCLILTLRAWHGACTYSSTSTTNGHPVLLPCGIHAWKMQGLVVFTGARKKCNLVKFSWLSSASKIRQVS